MHPGGRSRAVMSLLQNFVLRNSIDRALIGSGSNATVAASSGQGDKTFFLRSFQFQQQSRAMSAQGQGIPPEPPLDPESLSKLNQLKEGLQSNNEYFQKYMDKFAKLET